jgi:short-subunit dehydrogenase
MHRMRLALKYAVVTGASSGIGWHISRELASRGYSIIAVSNQTEQLNKLKSELESSFKTSVQIFDCDLSEISSAENIFDFCQKNNLQVEVLVNNAGMYVYGEVIGADIEKIRSILQVHMNTPVMLCRLFGALMAKNHSGYILNVSSISAVMPYPTISLYGPTKTFLRKFTRALRTELKETGVNVLCLLPGATATALYDTMNINLSLLMRLGIMKKPGVVAKAGVKALFKKRAECIPGLLNKIIMRFIPLIPHGLIRYIYRKTKR